MEPLPSLAGLSLAPDAEDEALPEPTEAAPLLVRRETDQRTVEVSKYNNPQFLNDLRTWKDLREVRARWNIYDVPSRGQLPREYFEDDREFYADWVQVSQQECMFYEHFTMNSFVRGSVVMHPIQHVLRVVTEAYVHHTQRFVTPEDMIRSKSICIVDGSNMFDVGRSRKSNGEIDSKAHRVTLWNQVIREARKSMPDIAIGFVKAQTVQPRVNREIAAHPRPVLILGERGYEPILPTYAHYYQMLSKVGRWVCLVVIEDWEQALIDKGKPRQCHPDARAGVPGSDLDRLHARPSHELCEYDDFLMMGLRDYIDFIKGQSVTFGNGRLVQSERSDKTEAQKRRWFNNWRTKPTKGVVTFDFKMRDNAKTETIMKTFATFLALSEVYRIRVFLPTATTPYQSLVRSLHELLRRYKWRYHYKQDYAQHPSKEPFYRDAFGRTDTQPTPSTSNSARDDINEFTQVTWEYSTRHDLPCPPGWPRCTTCPTPRVSNSTTNRQAYFRSLLGPANSAIAQQLEDVELQWRTGPIPARVEDF